MCILYYPHMQDAVDHLWYHVWATKTVKGGSLSCLMLHKPHMKQKLKRQHMRETELDEETLRRANFDRDLDRQKSLKNSRNRLKKAFMVCLSVLSFRGNT